MPWTSARGAPPRDELRRVARLALAEDVDGGDVTSEVSVPAGLSAEARLVARQAGVVAGLPLAREVFVAQDPDLRVELRFEDGERVAPGDELARISGRARSLLSAERVALNFVQRLSGIATLTRRFVDAIEGMGAVIVDTRKTTPGLRTLEKYAVRCGGGQNHRFGLADGFLLKDNHRSAMARSGTTLAGVVHEARRRVGPAGVVQVEVDTLEQLDEALAAGPDLVLLDNMTTMELAEAVRRCAGRVGTEASGGVTLDTVRAIAATGVDRISVGALTHSAPALDVALDFVAGDEA